MRLLTRVYGTSGVELGIELGVCRRFILAACSLEVVYTGKIAITVDTKKNITVSAKIVVYYYILLIAKLLF